MFCLSILSFSKKHSYIIIFWFEPFPRIHFAMYIFFSILLRWNIHLDFLFFADMLITCYITELSLLYSLLLILCFFIYIINNIIYLTVMILEELRLVAKVPHLLSLCFRYSTYKKPVAEMLLQWRLEINGDVCTTINFALFVSPSLFDSHCFAESCFTFVCYYFICVCLPWARKDL